MSIYFLAFCYYLFLFLFSTSKFDSLRKHNRYKEFENFMWNYFSEETCKKIAPIVWLNRKVKFNHDKRATIDYKIVCSLNLPFLKIDDERYVLKEKSKIGFLRVSFNYVAENFLEIRKEAKNKIRWYDKETFLKRVSYFRYIDSIGFNYNLILDFIGERPKTKYEMIVK